MINPDREKPGMTRRHLLFLLGGAGAGVAAGGLALNSLLKTGPQDKTIASVNIPTPESSPTSTPPPSEPSVTATKVPTIEAIQPFDCGILSPGDCAIAEYIKWETPSGGTVEVMGLALKAGKKFTIPEAMQVAAVEETYQGKPDGYRIVAARKDGSQIIISGDVRPVGVGPVGKELPAGTVVAESAESGLSPLIKGYTQYIQFSSEADLKKRFSEQTKNPPKSVINESQPSPQPSTEGGVTFFGVKPPPR